VPGKRFYDEDEAEQILKLASKKMGGIGSVPREQLLQTAAELGISLDMLAEAEEEYRHAQTLQREQREFDAYRRREFISHLGFFAFINAMLMLIDYKSDAHLGWSFWPLGLWGIGLIAQLWSTFTKSGDEYEKEFGRWRSRRERKMRGAEFTGYQAAMEEIATEVDVRAQKIEAIKQLRDRTGLDLKDAKDVVEAFVSQRS
jgi:hypothetical protein